MVTDTEVIACLPFDINSVERKVGFKLNQYYEDGLGEFKGAAIQLNTSVLYVCGPYQIDDYGASIYARGNESDPRGLLENVCKIMDCEYSELEWISDLVNGSRFQVVRLDDNGNEIIMESFISERTANYYANEFESRGHKQTYSVRKAI